MVIKKVIFRVLLMILAINAIAPAYGQIIYGSPSSGDIQLYYSSWKVSQDSGDVTIDQWIIPISFFIPIRDNFEARLQIAECNNNLEMPGENYSLSGINDLRLLLSHSFYDDRLLASVGVNVPTGKKKLDYYSERDVIEELSRDYLDFPIRRLGEGFGFNLLLGGATVAGPAKLGAGLMYYYSGEYEPYGGLAKYDPGDSYGINVSGELSDEKTTLYSNMAYTGFGVDKQNGIKAFKHSPQVDFSVGGVYAYKKYAFRINTSYLVRGRHTRYDLEIGDIVEQLKLYGNEFAVMARFDYYPSEKWYLSPQVETRQIGANEETDTEYLDKSSLYGFGGTIGNRLSETMNASAGFKYYTGSADGGNLDLSGFQVVLSLMATF